MEYAIGLLKQNRDALVGVNDVSDIAKSMMLQTLEEAIKVLEFRRYDSVFVVMENEKMSSALREIDNHIRSTSDPIPHIVDTLKKNLPEYSVKG
jgi:hypothetical protein